MRGRNVNLQVFSILLVIVASFLGNAVFFCALNTDTLRTSVEAEADMFSAFFAENAVSHIAKTAAASGQLPESLFRTPLFTGAENMYRAHVWITRPDGAPLYYSGDPKARNSPSAALPDIIDSAVLDKACEEGSAIVWSGQDNRFFLRGDCFVVRPLYDGALFLIISSHSFSFQAAQRRQIALLAGIDVVFMFLIIILIVNIISNYRREILRYATTDELTGLANRKSFSAAFADFIGAERMSEASLFLLDIDFFKQINDNYGHAAGDHALRFLSERIQDMVRECGGFAGRWGGDEFIGVLPLSGEAAHNALRKLCVRIEEARLDEGFRMTISAGAAPIAQGLTLARLSERADAALYESKEGGRNRASLYRAAADASEERTPETAPQTVEEAVVHAEEMVIPQTAEASETTVTGGMRFSERFMRYIREHFVKSAILGVRWMAPFVAGGGILIGLAFLFDASAVDLSAAPLDVRAQFGSITPTASLLNSIGSATFNFMLPVFAGFMAYGIAGEEAFMSGFVGGYMTIGSNSGFIGAIVAGFAAGVLTNEIRQFTRRLPKWIQKAAPVVVYPVLNLLFMQAVSGLIITPISSAAGRYFTDFLNSAASLNHVAAGGLSGMMMAVDMGGIVNKVAYQYGVEGILLGRANLMASVMAGGMTPPMGIALSMALFRRKFTEYELERGPGTLFMGLSFITEGALPYVFTDTFRVIPSCMAGSALAGALSTLFGCSLPAPHGGIFVLPVMERPLFYLCALIAGSALTAVLLGTWKKECGTEA